MRRKKQSHFPGKTVIGVTGGVGSGKSVVLKLFEERCGARILEADRIARDIMEPGGSAYEAVVELFGREILCTDGSLNRPAIAARIYKEPELRQTLNELVHPLTLAEVRRQIEEAPETLLIYEAALPEQARFSELCDRVLYVYVPAEERIERLIRGRGYSREKCLGIMASQLSEEEFRSVSDGELNNGGSPEETAAAFEALLTSWKLKRREYA